MRTWGLIGLVLVFLGCTGAPPAPITEIRPGQAVPGEDDFKHLSLRDFGQSPWQVPPGSLGRLEGRRVIWDLGTQGWCALEFLGPESFRWRFNPWGTLDERPSYAVIQRDLGAVEVKLETLGTLQRITTGVMTVEVQTQPWDLKVFRQGQLVLQGDRPLLTSGHRVAAGFKILEGDRFYGLGEKTGPLKKNGQGVKNWNSDTYKYTKTTDPIYSSIPFWVNAQPGRTWGLFLDHTGQSFVDLGSLEPGRGLTGGVGRELDLTFLGAEDLKGVLGAYGRLTGMVDLPPLWTLGYQQSRYSYKTQEEVLEVARTLREKKLPADAIYLDIHFMAGNRSFTWNRRAFPDPKAMVQTLKNQGFKTVTIVDPGIYCEDEEEEVFASGTAVGAFIKDEKGELVTGKVWPGECAFPDFTKPSTAPWWGDQYQVLTDLGIEGFWNDMNEPSVFQSDNGTLPWEAVQFDRGRNSPASRVHNVYGLTMTQATLAGLDKLRPGQRNFILGRAAYAGSQRVAALWTGDNSSQWEHLELNLSMILGLGLSGYSMTGADVGGYTGTPTPELFTRWMELGAWLPLFRNHTENGTAPQEPWAFGPEAEKASRQVLDRRYQFLPQFYQWIRESSLQGVPVARPLFMEFPGEEESYQVEDQFLVGRQILVSPLLKPGQKDRSLWLPKGSRWFELEGPGSWAGGQRITRPGPWGQPPALVRGGSQLLLRAPGSQFAGTPGQGPLELQLFPSGTSTETLYWDDGQTKAWKTGAYLEVQSTWQAAGSAETLDLTVLHVDPQTNYLAGGLKILRWGGDKVPRVVQASPGVEAQVTQEGALVLSKFPAGKWNLKLEFSPGKP